MASTGFRPWRRWCGQSGAAAPVADGARQGLVVLGIARYIRGRPCGCRQLLRQDGRLELFIVDTNGALSPSCKGEKS
jgi:hypothetical protein